MPTITLLYAGLLGILSLILAAAVGRRRGAAGISIGLGDDAALLVANRRHGNFVEFVPMALILMALLEMNGVGAMTLHVFGLVLTVARICHPLGLHSDTMSTPLRAIGAGATFLLTAVMSIWAVVAYLAATV